MADARGWPARFAIADAFLAHQRRPRPEIDAEVAASWQLIVARRGRVRVDDLATSCGWSRKRLWSRFNTQIGVSPKRAAMLVRFDTAARAIASGRPIAEVAAVCGYTDQSHLHRDVAAFTGCTPAALAIELHAAPATPQDLGGAFVQDTLA